MKTHLFGEKNGIANGLVVHLGKILLRMNGVAVAGKCTDLQAVLLNGVHKLFKLGLVVEQNLGVCVSIAGISAAADLDHIAAD